MHNRYALFGNLKNGATYSLHRDFVRSYRFLKLRDFSTNLLHGVLGPCHASKRGHDVRGSEIIVFIGGLPVPPLAVKDRRKRVEFSTFCLYWTASQRTGHFRLIATAGDKPEVALALV